MRRATIITLLAYLLSGWAAPFARGGESTQSVAITIAVAKTVWHSFRQGRQITDQPTYERDLPRIPSGVEDDTSMPYFDVVIRNRGQRDVLLPRFDASQVKLKVTDSQSKEQMLSFIRPPPHFGGSSGPLDAHVLAPGECLVHRVYMDRYAFPRSQGQGRQVVTLQAIYEAPRVAARDMRIRDLTGGTETRAILDLSKDLGLWHGTVYSEVREVILFYNGPVREEDDRRHVQGTTEPGPNKAGGR